MRVLGYYCYSLVEMLVWFKNWPSLIPLFLHRRLKCTRKIKLRRPNIEILVRSAMDVWAVKETFIDQFYTRYSLPVQVGWTVVDIGAGIGDYCIYAAHWNAGVRVYAFEPYTESFELMQRNLALNGIENVHAFQKAVWSRESQLALDIKNGEPLQISSQEHPVGHKDAEPIVVAAITLQNLFDDENLTNIDLLKMDCEGAEYEVLLHTPQVVFNKIDRIIMEYHDLDETRSHSVLAAFLKAKGYLVKCHPNFVHKQIGYLFAAHL